MISRLHSLHMLVILQYKTTAAKNVTMRFAEQNSGTSRTFGRKDRPI